MRRGRDDGPLFQQGFLGRPVFTRQHWRDHVRETEERSCDLCRRPTVDRLYGLNGKLFQFLAVLAQHERATGDDAWTYVRHIHREEIGDGEMGGNYAKLTWWGLTEAPPKDMPKRSGLWRTTGLGRLWIDGKALVPRYAAVQEWARYLQPSIVLGFGSPYVAPRDVWGKRFSQEEMHDDERGRDRDL